jgi:amino acid adenylation domain-containing protein
MSVQPVIQPRSTHTLVALLQQRVKQAAHAKIYTWLGEGENNETSFSAAELDRRARAIAAYLTGLNVKRTRALLLFGPGLKFLEALFGCLYAGIIAVPAYMPGTRRDHPRIAGILRDADCGLILTSGDSLESVTTLLHGVDPDAVCVATDQIGAEQAGNWSEPMIDASDVAYLQYTSGSTSSPKGVMITHANVLANLSYIAAQGGFNHESVSVSWLPHFHDMGLIYGFLQPLFSRFPVFLLSPAAFIHRPLRWLTAISNLRGTHCGGPNFAYELCVERVSPEEAASLDLSCWRVAFNGAEPVREDTLERFARHFSVARFDPAAFYTVYGLAEASLKVSSGDPGSGSRVCPVDARAIQQDRVQLAESDTQFISRLVSCGGVGSGHEVAIVNPESHVPYGENRIGEIWFSGPSVAAGYWQNPSATQQTFQAFLATGQGPYLRTGDLGFIRDGELYITGRMKDCIIIRGRNHYPQDIEQTVESAHSAVRLNGVAAFSQLRNGEESVIIVSEVNRNYRGDFRDVLEAVRAAVAAEHEVQAIAITLIKAGGLPKTSSGKVQRQECKAKFLENSLPVVAESVPEFEPQQAEISISRDAVLAADASGRKELLEEYLVNLAAQALHHAPNQVAPEQSLISLGMDSLMLFYFKQKLDTCFNVELPLPRLLHGTISSIAEALLTEIEQEKHSGHRSQPKPVPRSGSLSLSASQEQIWLMQQLFPESCAYNEALVFEISCALQPECLQQAINEIVRRHEILRTNFVAQEGHAVQTIRPAEPIYLATAALDCEQAPHDQLRAAVLREVNLPFSLDRDSLVRFLLLGASPFRHFLILSAHHIVCDGTSLSIIVHELASLYRSFAKGEASPLPELPVQYADYAVWQRELLRGEAIEAELEYWRKQLAGVAPLELPGDHPRPAIMGSQGETVTLELPAELTERLKEFCREEAVTLFMSILLGFQLLLGRYAGQEDVAVGTAISSRNHPDLEQMIGLFVNTLVLRTQLNSSQTFSGLIRTIRQRVIEAYAHRNLPITKLVEELQPERDLSRTPLFQVMFTLLSPLDKEYESGDVKFTVKDIDPGTAKFDLALRITESSPSLMAHFDYNTSLFEPATIRRMAGHLQTVLEKMVERQEVPIGEVSLLSAGERRQLLEEWNKTGVAYPQQSLHGLIEEQVERTPAAPAVKYEGESLTYAELNARANQLSRYLQKLGVGPDVLVGLCMERSLELMVGLLGILKAGGAYVPLDPNYPNERLAFMLNDCEAPVLLTQERFLGLLPKTNSRIVYLDVGWLEIAQHANASVASPVGPDSLAYVIYTSGSTGMPKGAMNTHGGIVTRLLWMQGEYDLQPSDRVLQKTPISFDVSVWELFWPLITGATLVFAKPEEHRDSDYLVQTIVQERITTIHFVPSMLRVFLEHVAVGSCKSLKRVIASGEALSADLNFLFHQKLGAELHNLYGPTEAAVDVTAWPCSKDNGATVPIGKPIANTRIYILDAEMQPTPVGVPGELCIGGVGLARGYWKRAGLTAERFVPDPVSGRHGERLYRTGDKAFWRRDGNVEYVGRLDHQVKIRGFRIELGEIEAALMQHEAISNAVAVVREDHPGDKRLVAYVVRQANVVEPSDAVLHEYLHRRLPEQMVPGAIVKMEKLLLTPSGKIDRKALPRPEYRLTQAMAAPGNAEEEIVCGIFAEVLKTGSVGVEENFFHLGGHSLLATQVVSRIRSVFGVELRVREIFESPTVAGVAQRVRRLRGAGLKTAPLLVRRQRAEEGVPLSYAQQRLWLIEQLEPGNAAYNMSFGVRLEGVLEREAVQWSLNEIVRRHEALRTSFRMRDGNPVQEIAAQAQVGVEEVDLCGGTEAEREEQLRRVAEAEAVRPFDLGQGPLLRVKLVRIAEQEHVLLLSMHHIVGDGWSSGVMMREFMQLYEGWVKGERPSLPELAVQYADYAVWQREWLQGEVLDKEMEYWRRQLGGVAPLELPGDHARPAVMSYRGGVVKVGYGAELVEKVKEAGRGRGVTLFMSVLAALQMVLGRYAGQEDVAVGTGIANRNREEIEGLIGFFVNTLVLRTEMGWGETLEELLQKVQRVALEAYQHQDVPFEKLVEALQPERDLSRTPLFQVMLLLQNMGMPELQLPGLKVSEYRAGGEVAKFDVMLTLEESGGGGMRGELSYARDLYEAATMERLAGHVEMVLERLAERGGTRIGEVQLLRAAERRQLLEWNDTGQEYRRVCLHELFEEQVERTPEKVAVEHGERQWSYAELNRYANQLAHCLVTQGVDREDLVGICMNRSPEMIAAMLAVWKAGAAYVPLDPQYPEQRIRQMLEDADARLMISVTSLHQRFEELSPNVLYLDLEEEKIQREHTGNPRRQVDSRQIAYVIYTSGSTGRPKGVMLTHDSAASFLTWIRQAFTTEELSGVLASTSICFDLSIFEMWGTLISGGTMVLAENVLSWWENVRDGRALSPVRLINTVPSAMAELVRRGSLPPGVCSVNLAGEALSETLVDEIYQSGPVKQVNNLYGPTETTTYSSWTAVAAGTRVTIGRGVANTQLYVLDQQLQLVPPGLAGELYIAGSGLARGYWKQPDRTAERFVPDPFSTVIGQRMYRTGDLVRWRRDGQLEYTGRADYQVKVRGFRIELGEIETVLGACKGLAESAVVVKERDGDKQLVAYVAPRPGAEVSEQFVREYLHQHLPAYMVPAHILLLESLPKTPNGKIDRKALPEPERNPRHAVVAPRNETEETIAHIWAEVLNVDQVGVEEDFFAIGGHSLLAARIIARVEERYKTRIALRKLFESPTVAAMAAEIAAGAGTPALRRIKRITRRKSANELILHASENS